MTTVFIGGSRAISRLNPPIRERLDRIVAKGLPVIVGDANGADKAIQKYFFDRDYRNIEVFCSGRSARNNLGNWKLRCVRADAPSGTAAFFTAKDRVMADEATVGFMLWDGKSTGTLANIDRLVKQHKKVVIYVQPAKYFCEIKKANDWENFFSDWDRELRKKVNQRSLLGAQDDASLSQTPTRGTHVNLENERRFFAQIERARASLRAGRSVRLEDIEEP